MSTVLTTAYIISNEHAYVGNVFSDELLLERGLLLPYSPLLQSYQTPVIRLHLTTAYMNYGE